ncbi:23S rRNA (guanosine(2251)-2'-O)-methyltransferase RlmB [Alicyclobacillaceae bacterium I2511]|nr:23S rRNA (guanosine(2251)-2'-O)-methyltransferase RlmB [Alicyclobacillaceae bacterium I2511]
MEQGTVEPQEEAAPSGLLAGRHSILEALKAGRPFTKIMVSIGASGGSLAEILARAKETAIVVQWVPRESLTETVGHAHHQGVAAYIAPFDYVDLDDVIGRSTGQTPLLILLDELSDPYNFGAILRTAEAVGVQGVVIPKRRSVPLTETVVKASAGAAAYVPVARVPNLVQAMDILKQAGYWIFGTDVSDGTAYTQADFRGPVALVVGAEGKGLGRLVKEHCDILVHLPMLGEVQSLNASVAAGVVLYEILRQRT